MKLKTFFKLLLPVLALMIISCRDLNIPYAINGVIDLRGNDGILNDYADLQGEWLFAENIFTDYRNFSSTNQVYFRLISVKYSTE